MVNLTINEQNLVPESLESTTCKTKTVVIGDSYVRSVRYSENIIIRGISGSITHNLIEKQVTAGTDLPLSSQTGRIGKKLNIVYLSIFFIQMSYF